MIPASNLFECIMFSIHHNILQKNRNIYIYFNFRIIFHYSEEKKNIFCMILYCRRNWVLFFSDKDHIVQAYRTRFFPPILILLLINILLLIKIWGVPFSRNSSYWFFSMQLFLSFVMLSLCAMIPTSMTFFLLSSTNHLFCHDS